MLTQEKVLIIGNGARESAIAWKLKTDNPELQIVSSPGNAGTQIFGENFPEAELKRRLNFPNGSAFTGIDFVVIGPENYLAQGVADKFLLRHIPVFGPTKRAAEIESSKIWSGKFMEENGILSPQGQVVETVSSALKAWDKFGGKALVLKGNGLAGGKAVEIARNEEEVKQIATNMLNGKYGKASKRLWAQEFLEGKELSVMAFVDGERISIMPSSRDFKKAFDGDEGPNTGSMGAICMPGLISPDQEQQILENIFEPTVKGLAQKGRPFRGALYAGLMQVLNEFYVLEFNARFGDPEAQVTLPRLETPLLKIMKQVSKGRLDPDAIEWNNKTVVAVTLASNGYPDKYDTGYEITGSNSLPENTLFFAGGAISDKNGNKVTSGGRVGTAVGIHQDPIKAREAAYDATELITFSNKFYRTDIGVREVY